MRARAFVWGSRCGMTVHYYPYVANKPPKFAYNEMSFIIIRLLQNFSSVSLDLDAFPPGAHPPPEWAMLEGRKAMDKIHPKMHLTMYSEGGLWLKMNELENA
jgi:hypothetical protein